jgi:hypothetical protein
MLERNRKVREFKPSAKGKWDVFVSSTMQVSVGDQIRVTPGFREGKNAFKNNDIAKVRDVTDSELVLHDGRRMRRDGSRIDQGVCITSHASQCRTVDQVVVLPDDADAKGGPRIQANMQSGDQYSRHNSAKADWLPGA